MHVMEGKHASIHYSSQAVHKVQEGQDALHKCISTKYIYNGTDIKIFYIAVKDNISI